MLVSKEDLVIGQVYEVADPVVGFSDYITVALVENYKHGYVVRSFPNGNSDFRLGNVCLFRNLEEV